MSLIVRSILLGFLFCSIWLTVQTQTSVPVTYVSAATKDSVRFAASIPRPSIKRGQDIVLSYSIQNRGEKSIIFLGSKSEPEARVVDLGLIRIFSSFQHVDDHFPVTYRFVTVPPGKAIRGTIRVPAKTYLEDKKYSFENATVQVEFAYMVAKSPPEECKETHFPTPCLFAVSEKAKEILLGNLQIDIE